MDDIVFEKLTIDGKEYDAVFFHGPKDQNGFLSNWYMSPFEVGNIQFNSNEQYFMFRKCLFFEDLESAEAVLETKEPEDQKAIGRSLANFDKARWSKVCQAFMLIGLLEKFKQNEDLKKMLLDTGDAYLVECARTDIVWACGCKLNNDDRFDMEKWTGKNLLGYTLMVVRSVLREEE